ncbi:MAG TPA: tetratricopeptide repeat protein [Bacteroidota bacterium]|nr:tetratricopeptide repeat protein [Bacteroidota bacterium]
MSRLLVRILPLIFLATILRAQLPLPAQEAQNRFRLAQSFEQAGDYERATRIYEDLVRSDSANFIYFDGLRRCYTELKNYAGAIALSRRRLALQPSDIGVIVELGSIYCKSGDEARGDSVWQSAIDLMPKNIGAYSAVATSESENRLFDKSIATYLKGRHEIGNATLFCGELATLYSMLLDYANATREYLAFLSLDERQLGLVESRLASFTSKNEGLAAATAVVEEAAKSGSSPIVFQRLLLWLTMEGKDFSRGLRVARELDGATNAGGAEILAFSERAFHEKAYKVAAEGFRFDIEHYSSMPQLPAAKFGYAKAVEELTGEPSQADTGSSAQTGPPSETEFGHDAPLKLFLSLAQEYPNSEMSVNALYHASLIYFRRYSDLSAAERIIDSIVTLPIARALTPVLLATAGEIDVARATLERAIFRYHGIIASPFASPQERTTARFHIAEIQYFRGEFDTAASALLQIAQSPSDDETNDALLLVQLIQDNEVSAADALKQYAKGELLQRQGKLSESLALFGSIVDANPDAPLADKALLKQGSLSVALKQYIDALSIYRRLLKDYPKSIFRDRAQFEIGSIYEVDVKDKASAIHSYEELLSTYPNSLYLEQARKRIRDLRGDAL